jgi:hypothetical protein
MPKTSLINTNTMEYHTINGRLIMRNGCTHPEYRIGNPKMGPIIIASGKIIHLPSVPRSLNDPAKPFSAQQ